MNELLIQLSELLANTITLALFSRLYLLFLKLSYRRHPHSWASIDSFYWVYIGNSTLPGFGTAAYTFLGALWVTFWVLVPCAIYLRSKTGTGFKNIWSNRLRIL